MLRLCFRPEELRVRLGEWDVNNDSEFFPNVEFDVLSMKIHPDYYPGNLYNDLAVIRIDGFVDFARNAHISPVCLPDAFQVNRRNLKRDDDSICLTIKFFVEFCWQKMLGQWMGQGCIW